MGRTRTKSNKIRPSKVSLPPSASKPSPQIPLLLEKAQSLIVECDYPLAERFIRRILENEPDHAEAREMLGVVLLEMGELEGARMAFMSLVSPSPSGPDPPPPSAYLYLAQLTEDDPHAALAHYQTAVDILNAQLKGKGRASEDNEAESELRSNIVRALVGMVEIWMDPSYDLCFDPRAETTCEELLGLALRTDPGNAEALQMLSSVRMSQQRPEEARDYLLQSYSIWKDLDLDNPKLPSIPTRLSLTKLFLELSLFTPALLVLHGIMAADDQEVEAWYLEGWCFFLMAEHARGNGGVFQDEAEGGEGDRKGMRWEELARDAKDCLETCQILHKNEDHPDKPLLEHVEELIKQLDGLGIQGSLTAEGDRDGCDVWEDDKSSNEDDIDME